MDVYHSLLKEATKEGFVMNVYWQYMQEPDEKVRPVCPCCGQRMEDGDRPGEFFCIPCEDDAVIARKLAKWEEF